MSDTGPFSVGEKVLVPHTDKFYEAKCLKAQKREDGLWYYLLHYTGWNKKWDEWVEETGLRRAPSAAGTATAPVVAMTNTAAGGGSTAVPPSSGAGTTAASQGKKQAKNGLTVQRQRKTADAAGAPAIETVEVQLTIELPAQLKKQLLDQYDAVHEEQKLVPLPRRPTVMQVFEQYIEYVKDKQQESPAEEDLVSGLQVYFDKALYQCLLFRAERQQAEQVLASGQAPSAVYGAEHLLRLFVKLPELLPITGAAEEQLQLLVQRMEDLLTFLQIHILKLFVPVSDYVPAAAALGGLAASAATVSAGKR